MIINKTVGTWYEESTVLDDYAYMLFIKHLTDKYDVDPTKIVTPQKVFCTCYKNNVNNNILFYYKQAVLLLRILKIEKIINVNK